MRAIRYAEFGNPTDMLSLEELPTPEPSTGEVRIRLTHRAINPSDVLTVAGLYGRLPKLPATPGNEGVGVIDKLGDGVKGFSIGQRVIPLNANGTWKEYAVVNTQWLIPVPDEVSDQTAAQFIVNPVTAWVMLVEELGLKEGDWLLQTAAGSTLGRIVLQIAQLKGYKTINFVRRKEQVDELKALGADVVICTGDDDVLEQVHSATDGKGAQGAIEAVGGTTGTLAMQSLRAGGTMLVYGLLSGQPSELNWGEMLFKGITVKGFWLTHWFRVTPPPQVATTLGELMGLMAQGHLTPPVEAEYDLADIEKAVIHSETPGRSGKVILTG